MCAVFGLLDFKGGLTPAKRLYIIKELGKAAEVRGTDASGIAYVQNGRIQIQKAPRPARKMRWRIDPKARCIMGHTRMTTQGSESLNYNNHPFVGKAGRLPFALAHNGVLYNDGTLREQFQLPESKIETDSYVAVQLLEREGNLSAQSLQRTAEALKGSFTITLLDANENLYFIKGNNPLTILLFPDLGCYLYASTAEILCNALEALDMADMKAASIKVNQGDILRIGAEGKRSTSRFDNSAFFYDTRFSLWDDYHSGFSAAGQSYLDDLKSLAGYFGYTPEIVDHLIRHGFMLEEIEEFFYERAPV